MNQVDAQWFAAGEQRRDGGDAGAKAAADVLVDQAAAEVFAETHPQLRQVGRTKRWQAGRVEGR